MLKKYMIIPIVLAVLGAAFVLVSFLVYISRGKYVFIKQKLKIGALILTLTALSYNCQSNQDDIVLCYKAAVPTPQITILNEINQNQEIIVDALVNRTVTGTIQEDHQSYPHYSFRIVPGQRVLIVDDLLATGGTVEATIKIIEELGGVVAGLIFLIELDELKGREKLTGYDVKTLMNY